MVPRQRLKLPNTEDTYVPLEAHEALLRRGMVWRPCYCHQGILYGAYGSSTCPECCGEGGRYVPDSVKLDPESCVWIGMSFEPFYAQLLDSAHSAVKEFRKGGTVAAGEVTLFNAALSHMSLKTPALYRTGPKGLNAPYVVRQEFAKRVANDPKLRKFTTF